MIKLNDHALFICYPDGRVEPLDLDRLVGEIAGQSQNSAFQLESWMIEHVVQSIVHYLRHELKKDSVTLQDFVNLSQELLNNFLESQQEKTEEVCDLYQLAQKAGYGFELHFYDILRDHLSKMSHGGHASCVFVGLKRCVKFLAGHQRWRNRCRHINDEIVEFIRESLARFSKDDIKLSVT
jgi:hypothetical protein